MRAQTQHQGKQMTNETTTNINGSGQVVKVVTVATNAEQIAAAGLGLITGGPLGALASWGCIRAFAGKWTPWMLVGTVAAPVLLLGQLVTLGVVSSAFTSGSTGVQTTQSR